MAGFVQIARDLALLLARVGLGLVLILHGWRRWQVLGVDSQVDYLRRFGTPFAEYAAWGGTLLELIGGVFLIVGALTPLVAAVVVVEQVLIIAYTSWSNHFFLNSVQDGAVTWRGGYEYNLVIGLLALLLVVFGSGRIGIDRLFRRNRTPNDELTADSA